MTRITHTFAAVAALAGLLAGCSDGADRPLAATAGPSTGATGSASPTDDGSATDGRVKAPSPGKIAQTDEFGFVAAVRDVDGAIQVDVDRVDWLSGAEAEAAAAADGTDVSNDYYLVNDNPRVRTYRLADDVVIWGDIGFGHVGDPQRVTRDDWRQFVTSERASHTPFHLDVQDGVVVGIEEQYRP